MSKQKLKITDVVTRMFKQYGLTEEEVKSVLDSGLGSEIEVEDAVANKLGANLLTVDSAKADPNVRKAITAEALNGFDTLADQLMEEYKVPDDKRTPLKTLKTHGKMKDLVKLLIDMKGEEVTSLSADKNTQIKTIKDLHDQMAALKEQHVNALKAKDDSLVGERIDWRLKDIYNGLDYALADVPKEVAIQAAMGVVKAMEQKDGLSYKMNDAGELELVKKDGTPYFDATSNKQIGPRDYISRSLQSNKLLKVSDSGNGAPKPQKTVATPSSNGTDRSIKVDKAELNAAIEESQRENNF